MKWIHKLFSLAGLSLGGANACIKHGCKNYCGYSPSEHMRFYELKHPQLMQWDRIQSSKCDDSLLTHIEDSN